MNSGCMVVPDIFCVIVALFSLHTKVCISSNVPGRKHRITVRFRVHSRLGSPQYGPCSMLVFWRKEFGGYSKISKKCVPP